MKLLKALFFAFIAFSSFAQKNYTAGFIILKNQSDTLKGLINDQDWVINPTKINFKDATNQEQSYRIEELSSFGITGKENYLVAQADLDITPFARNEIRKDRNQDIVKDTLLAFLVLLKADYSLLYVKDGKDKDHFFYKHNQVITELINHKFLQERQGKTFEFNNQLYQKQLELLFNECNKKISTNNVEYDIRSLTDKFIEFSECIGCTYTCYVKKKEDKSIFTLGIMAGVASDRNLFTQHDYFERTYVETKNLAATMLFGISASFSSRRNLNRNVFVLESFFNTERIKLQNASIGINYLNYVSLFRRQFINNNSIKPFVGAGIHLKHLISYADKTFLSGDRLNLFLVGDVGIKWNNVLLSARIKVKPKKNEEDVSIVYKNVAEVVETISYQRLNFQFNLTYLLFNTARKAK